MDDLSGQKNSPMKAGNLSPDENPPCLELSSSNVACAYAYMRSIAELCFFFALASWVASGSGGQVSDCWSLFKLRCLDSNTFLLHQFFFMMANEFRKVVPYFGFSLG